MSTASKIIATALVLTLGILVMMHRVSALNERLGEPLSSQQIASGVPAPAVLELASMGHQEAMADLVWLNALSFWGEHFRQTHDATWLDPHIDAIIALDPRFRLVFEWAGAVIMYGGTINNESIMAANRVLEQGIERFPLDWSLRFMLGVNYAFEMKVETEEDREHIDNWRDMGNRQLAIAAELPGAPPKLNLLASSLTRRWGSWEEQVQRTHDGYMLVAPAEARTVRSHLERLLPSDEVEQVLQARRVQQRLVAHSAWGVLPSAHTLVLHPDPARLFAEEEIRPLSFEMTR